MTKGEHWTVDQIEKDVERNLRSRNGTIETARQSKIVGYKEGCEAHNKAHLTDDEYRDYIREVIKQQPLPPKYQDKFSAKEKTQIKKDWQEQFPEMGYSKKSLYLAKLVGPLHISINLSLGNKWEVAQYSPESSTHSYTYRYDDIARGVGTDSIPSTIYPHDHFTEYIKAAKYLKENCSILEGSLTLDKIFKAYSSRNSWNHVTAGTPATIAAWAGGTKKAKQYLEWGYGIIEKMYKERNCMMDKYIVNYDILGRNLSLDLPFKELWLRYHQDMLDNPQTLRQIARKEVHRRPGLKFAPYYEIEDAPYKEGNIFEKK